MKSSAKYVICALSVFAILALGCGSDGHPFSEIKDEALKSASDNFKDNETEITTQDRDTIALTVLNQYLKKFQKDETHYTIRLTSYEVTELNFADTSNFVMYFDGQIKVVPQDKSMFMKIYEGSSWKEDGSSLVFDIRIGITGSDNTYRMVETSFPSRMNQ